MSLTDNTAKMREILSKFNALPEAGGGEADPVLQEKTVTPTTSQQEVAPDTGYDGLSKVTVGAMPAATQATPTISVDTDGKITASATQSAGYVPAGTKSAIKQLTTKSAQTFTPGTSDQTIAAQQFLTGIQTIKGEPNLLPQNIPEGTTLFGVQGTKKMSSSGIDTSDATAAAEDIVSPKTAYVNGTKLTGTNPYAKAATDTEVSTQLDLIQQIKTALEGKVAGSGEGAETLFDGSVRWATDVYTPTADITEYTYIPHSLGERPDIVVMFPLNGPIHSDIKAHMEFAINRNGYGFMAGYTSDTTSASYDLYFVQTDGSGIPEITTTNFGYEANVFKLVSGTTYAVMTGVYV